LKGGQKPFHQTSDGTMETLEKGRGMVKKVPTGAIDTKEREISGMVKKDRTPQGHTGYSVWVQQSSDKKWAGHTERLIGTSKE